MSDSIQTIHGVQIKKLPVFADERGRLTVIMRSDDAIFDRFGQIYSTTAFPGVIKAWHFHREQSDRLCAVHGRVKLVLHDSRDAKFGFGYPGETSPTAGQIDEYILSPDDPILVKIPAWIIHGIQNIGDEQAVVLNMPDRAYRNGDPDVVRLDFNDEIVPYRWQKKA